MPTYFWRENFDITVDTGLYESLYFVIMATMVRGARKHTNLTPVITFGHGWSLEIKQSKKEECQVLTFFRKFIPQYITR